MILTAETSRVVRVVAAALLVGLLLVALTGCATGGSGLATDTTAGAPAEPAAPALPVTVPSADGTQVTVTDASRLIPLAGSISETLFALGLGDRVVARDISATAPEAAALPLVTRSHDVSPEAVLSLHPTLVLAQTDTGPPESLEQIRQAGVPVLVLEQLTSLDDVAARVRAIAAAVGLPEAGEQLVERSDAGIAAAQAAIPADALRPKVAFLYLRGQAGVYLIGGKGSGADSMIAAAGATDAGTALGLDRAFTPITSEALVNAAPDVILMTTTGLESVGGIDGLLQIPGIAETPAGRDRRVITEEDGLLYSFGPRTPEALADLIAELYPVISRTREDQVAVPVHDLPKPRRTVRGPVLLVILTVALVAACIVATGSGAFAISPGEIVASLADRIGMHIGTLPGSTAQSVLWNIRLPRVALAVVVGASLGCGGAAMQGSFSNPLAEPGIVGVSSGAALGAVAAIVTGATLLGTWTITGAAFLGGLVVVLGVYWAARSGGRTEVVTLILTGIAVNAFVGALIGLLMFVSTDAQLRSVTFWNLGSLAQATWPKVLAVTPAAVIGIVVATTQAHRLDLLALGDRSARHIGVDVERLRVLMLTVVAVLTAAAVAVSGIILFVGLVVPHLVRMVAGPGHRLLLPASALGGAVLLVVADLVARTIAPPAELPLGVLTALVGSPFFFWMLRRTRASQGGWA